MRSKVRSRSRSKVRSRGRSKVRSKVSRKRYTKRHTRKRTKKKTKKKINRKIQSGGGPVERWKQMLRGPLLVLGIIVAVGALVRWRQTRSDGGGGAQAVNVAATVGAADAPEVPAERMGSVALQPSAAKVSPPSKKFAHGEIIFFYKKMHTDLTESQKQAIKRGDYSGHIGMPKIMPTGFLIYQGICVGIAHLALKSDGTAEIGKVEIKNQYQDRHLCTPFVSFMIEQLKLLGIKLINMRNASNTKSKKGGPPGLPAHICYCKAALQNGYKITISNDYEVKYKDINLNVDIRDLPNYFSEDNRCLSFILVS